MKKLIIVESPSKTKTIQSYLGNDAVVVSSKGHIRDLSTSGPGRLGVDVKNDFKPDYVVLKDKQSVVNQLIKEAKGKEVYIATDPDREGEAIGWHIAQVLNLDTSEANRIEFREITKPAILEALKHPRKLDQNLVNSQEARRILDRIIGFKLSTLLQSKIHSKSAGRVQSVALKLIVALEKEILAFKSETYYEITATFDDMVAKYIIPSKKRLSKEEADLIVKSSTNPFVIEAIKVNETTRKPKPAFITSTLQQDAISYLSMSAERAMRAAQSLYEGVEIDGQQTGLITYMRTDSTRLSPIFINQAKAYIEKHHGQHYVGKYHATTKESAQDAHEGIRPTNLELTPEYVSQFLDNKDQIKLYKRIYERTLASLMSYAKFEKTEYTLNTNDNRYKVEGIRLLFDGFTKVYDDIKTKDKLVPHYDLHAQLDAKEVVSIEKHTEPKSRYTEATLIKDLESKGIGRPSTYAQIIETLKKRLYVLEEEKKLVPTEQGILTIDVLETYFKRLIDVQYTSLMEKDLDLIATAQAVGPELLREFYDNFMPMLEKAQATMEKKKPELLEEICPVCGKPLVVRKSKYGAFIGCSGFPNCNYIKKEN